MGKIQKKYIAIFSIAFFAALADQAAKFLIAGNFALNESLPIIKNMLHFTYIANTGSAFGLFKDLNLILTIISFIAIFAVIYSIKNIENGSLPMKILAGMLLGGIMGNLIDRLWHGHVIDFIDFRIWPVFNVADSLITISIISLIIYNWKK